MFALTSNIKIGKWEFTSVNSVTVTRSIHDIGAKATIKLPVTSLLKQKGKAIARTETAKEIGVKDKVEIKLGYNGKNLLEFQGYVMRVNHRCPIEIECEDRFFLTRFHPIDFSVEKTTVKECLNTLFPDIQIGYCIDLTLKNFIVPGKTPSYALDMLKKEYGLSIFFDINDKLYVCRGTDIIGKTVKYEMERNVIKSDDLIYELEKQKPLLIKAISYDKKGEQLEAEVGNKEGTSKTLYFYDVENEKELQLLAHAEHARYSYDGYKGKLETFIQPYALPGMVASIKDPHYPEREGNYLIESTQVTFSDRGARRTIEIGVKI